jgi:hypothetical protein
MFRKLLAICAAVAALAGSLSIATANSYGIISKFGPVNANDGLSVHVRTDVLQSVNCSNFSNHDVWYGLTPDFSFWIESGFTTGSGQAGCNNQKYFWADNRNGGGYHEHYPNVTWTLGLTYQIWIQKTPGSATCSWDINVGTSNQGRSTSNCPGNGRALEAGVETTTTNASSKVKGFGAFHMEKDSFGTWRQDVWEGATLSPPGSPNIQWQNSSMNSTEEVLNVAF